MRYVQIGPLGLPVRMANNGEMDAILRKAGRHRRVCVRVADQPDAQVPAALARRRRKDVCSECRAPIWYDPAQVHAPEQEIRTCTQCVLARLQRERKVNGKPIVDLP